MFLPALWQSSRNPGNKALNGQERKYSDHILTVSADLLAKNLGFCISIALSTPASSNTVIGGFWGGRIWNNYRVRGNCRIWGSLTLPTPAASDTVVGGFGRSRNCKLKLARNTSKGITINYLSQLELGQLHASHPSLL